MVRMGWACAECAAGVDAGGDTGDAGEPGGGGYGATLIPALAAGSLGQSGIVLLPLAGNQRGRSGWPAGRGFPGRRP